MGSAACPTYICASLAVPVEVEPTPSCSSFSSSCCCWWFCLLFSSLFFSNWLTGLNSTEHCSPQCVSTRCLLCSFLKFFSFSLFDFKCYNKNDGNKKKITHWNSPDPSKTVYHSLNSNSTWKLWSFTLHFKLLLLNIILCTYQSQKFFKGYIHWCFICRSVLPACLCNACVSCTSKNQNKVSEPWD